MKVRACLINHKDSGVIIIDQAVYTKHTNTQTAVNKLIDDWFYNSVPEGNLTAVCSLGNTLFTPPPTAFYSR